MGKKGKARKKKNGLNGSAAVAKPAPEPAVIPAPPSEKEATPVVPPPQAGDPSRPIVRVPDRPTTTAERRLFRRVPFFRRVEYKFESLDDFKKELANDISLGGMFIKTEVPEELGTVLYLQFDLKDGSPILHGYGKVVRVNRAGVPGFDPGMGVEFLKFDDESLERIRALVAERWNG